MIIVDNALRRREAEARPIRVGLIGSGWYGKADLLRLNLAIPPSNQGANNLGLLGNDLAGFPNGRRVFDDVTTIELRAVAGATLPLVDKSFTPDAAASQISDGLTADGSDTTAMGTQNYLLGFPYLGTPHSGFAAGT